MAQRPKKTREGSAPKKKTSSQVSSKDASASTASSGSSSAAAPSSEKATAPRRRSRRPRRPGELSRFQKGVIIVFIVIFALSTLAGAFASMVQGEQQQTTQQDSTEKPTVASMDERYEPMVTELEQKVADNAEDKASLLSLGRYCFQWGAYVRMLGTTDADTSHANELFEKAISAYDKYLELEDSSAVRVDRALCQYYEGETSEAKAALEELTEKDPAYAPAWANLGMILESSGATDDAKAAYQKAIDNDPDDEYQAKTYAEQRLQAIEQAAEQAANASDGSGSGDDAAGSDSSDDSASDSSAADGQNLADELASGAGL